MKMLEISHHTHHDGSTVISLRGRFDFSSQSQFNQGIQRAMQSARGDIYLDFSGVDYLDSSALGSLLVVRDMAKRGNKGLEIINAQGATRKVLEIANFGRIFKLS